MKVLPYSIEPEAFGIGLQAIICHEATEWSPEDKVVVLVTPEGEDRLGTAFGAAMGGSSTRRPLHRRIKPGPAGYHFAVGT